MRNNAWDRCLKVCGRKMHRLTKVRVLDWSRDGGKDKWRKEYLQVDKQPGNAMMNEHQGLGIARVLSPSLLSSPFPRREEASVSSLLPSKLRSCPK